VSERRIGVYICYCGGNISDHVACEQVRDAIKDERDVTVAKTTMFACSDATQREIADDIREGQLDGLVIASCSPTLHRFTFREMCKRAGLNPYQYVQVNLREQCSWAHTDNVEYATEKAIQMVKGGIAKARYTEALQEIRIKTVKKVLVIGAGIAGLRAALALSDLGLPVVIAEREAVVGGWANRFGRMYARERRGREIVSSLVDRVRHRANITLYTNAELTEKGGSVGDFDIRLRVGNEREVCLNVGAIVICTGFESYKPGDGELGYGSDGVLTLPEFKELLDGCNGRLEYRGTQVKAIAYIYCVGSREPGSKEGARTYCSRYCCSAAVHASMLVHEISPGTHQSHLFRDLRTYGRYELLYEEARKKGAVFIKFDDQEPPEIEQEDGKYRIRVKDILTAGEELELQADLVVLVTGMIPRENGPLISALKLPVGLDGFFKEIHPKLRPVETVIDGVFIAGSCQGPRNSAESVASALAAAAKSASLLMKGYVELEPLIAAPTMERITWHQECAEACPYSAIEKTEAGNEEVAEVNQALCKGCGSCVPLCPENAIEVRGYTDEQIRAMIGAMASGV
jgi:heterodisulfide reductase subunit A